MALQKYDFDLVHSSINFSVRHLMVSKVRGHFSAWSGDFQFDDADPTKSVASVSIDAKSIDTKEPKRDDHLRSADFLEVEKFPHITFKSTSITKTGDGTFKAAGDLTIHGVTKPITLDVEYAGTVKDPWGGNRLGFSAHTHINRKDFGLVWNVVLEAGGITVGDKVEISVEVEAIHKA